MYIPSPLKCPYIDCVKVFDAMLSHLQSHDQRIWLPHPNSTHLDQAQAALNFASLALYVCFRMTLYDDGCAQGRVIERYGKAYELLYELYQLWKQVKQ
jgi:hypothetical protein